MFSPPSASSPSPRFSLDSASALPAAWRYHFLDLCVVCPRPPLPSCMPPSLPPSACLPPPAPATVQRALADIPAVDSEKRQEEAFKQMGNHNCFCINMRSCFKIENMLSFTTLSSQSILHLLCSPAAVQPWALPATCLCFLPLHGAPPQGSPDPQVASVRRK